MAVAYSTTPPAQDLGIKSGARLALLPRRDGLSAGVEALSRAGGFRAPEAPTNMSQGLLREIGQPSRDGNRA